VRSLHLLALASSIFFQASLTGGCGSTVPDHAGSGGDGPAGGKHDLGPAPEDLGAIFPAALRLPESVTPRSYELTLRIDPATPTFTGKVRIEVELARATRLLRMHSDGLTIASATATVAGKTLVLEARNDDSQLALVAATALPAGVVTLDLTWQGPLPEAPVGIYRVQDGGHWYVFTQFEPLEARRAFPSFDEPRFKTPYTTIIEVPKGLGAFSNNPERALTTTADGWSRHEFEPTPPLPTYLIAFAIGDFDVVEGANVSGGKVPFRVIAPKGKGHLASFVLDKAPRHLAALEQWFGTPYPFAKLDLVAVPNFSSSGMENAGLITFREALLLTDGDKAAIEERLWCESVVAHELAHMWFGDLVTMQWWDDVWLNEAFATWMSRKILTIVSPELDINEQALRGKFGVMHADARVNARSVRQPITKDGDIYNAFDGITYSKGAAVLSMVEAWIGPEPFQAGVRAYLAEHALGSATTHDLLEHLGREGNNDVATVVSTFLDQPGVPLVTLDWRCEAAGVVSIDVTQAPYKLMGDPRAVVPGSWQIPICARLSDGKKTIDHCELLTSAKATWRVEAGFCPTFSHPNIAEAGYYRWETRLGPISTARGDKAAFAGYIASLRGGVDMGRIPLAQMLEGVGPLFEASVSPSELDDLIASLAQVARFDPEAPRDPSFQKKAHAWLDRIPLDLSLGTTARERRRMPSLVRALAGLTLDKRVFAQASKVAQAFLDELEGGKGKAVSVEDVGVYLPLYVYSLGREAKDARKREAVWTRLRAAFDKARDPNEREVLIEALGTFDDPELVVKSYGLILDGTLRAQDLRTLRARTSGRRPVAEALWSWFTGNFDALVAKLGSKSAPGLPGFAYPFCEVGDDARVEAFFATKKATLPNGIDRPLAQTIEVIRACVVARARYGEEARAWYQKR